MKNGLKPINPVVNSRGFVSHQSLFERKPHQEFLTGLSKREHFACEFIKGELSGNAKEWANEKDLVQRGLLIADELLKQLQNERR